jgi:hypothetical protein
MRFGVDRPPRAARWTTRLWRVWRRLTDEYDAAQERGEVASQGKPSTLEGLATTADIGLTHKDIHEARLIRDAEKAEPSAVSIPLHAAALAVSPSKGARKPGAKRLIIEMSTA